MFLTFYQLGQTDHGYSDHESYDLSGILDDKRTRFGLSILRSYDRAHPSLHYYALMYCEFPGTLLYGIFRLIRL